MIGRLAREIGRKKVVSVSKSSSRFLGLNYTIALCRIPVEFDILQ